MLFRIGLAIPKNAKFPPRVTDIESAIRSIDIAYHMNHRKGVTELFDPPRPALRSRRASITFAPLAREDLRGAERTDHG